MTLTCLKKLEKINQRKKVKLKTKQEEEIFFKQEQINRYQKNNLKMKKMPHTKNKNKH